MFGAQKQVLIVGNDGVQLYRVKGKSVSLYRDFSDAGGALSEELRKSFKALKLPLLILYDVVEQQYRKEAIPKVGFMDKSKVIKRKLQMAFPQQQMLAYLPLKQKPKENESMVALFAGLQTNLTITQIMDAVISSGVSLIGSGLLPLESSTLVIKLADAAHKKAGVTSDTRWSVLMTHHKTGGLRQIVIKDGELALTRLTPLAIDPNKVASLTEEMIREFNATLTYLSRFGYIPSDGLDLIVVDSAEVCNNFRQYQIPVTHFYPLTQREAGNLIGLKLSADDGEVFSEVIHAGWNGMQSKLLVPLTAPAMDKVKGARQTAQALILASVIGIFYLGYQSGMVYSGLRATQNDINELQAKVVSLQHEHDELAKGLTAFADPETTRTTLAVYDYFAKNHLDVEPTLNGIMSQVERGKLTINSIAIAPEKTDAGASAAAPPPVVAAAPVMGSDGVVMAAVPPKPIVTIDVVFGFPTNAGVEESALVTKSFFEKLKTRFPGRSILVGEMVGNLALNETVQGVSEQIGLGEVKGNDVKDGTSGLTIKGALE